MRRDAEEGSVVPLILVCFLVAAGFVIVASAATSLYLERLRLLSVADGASLAAAESFAVQDAVVAGDRVEPRLTDAGVATATQQYLSEAPVADLEGLALIAATAPRGTGAEVVLQATWRPPIVSALLPVALPVQVTSDAAARFR